MVTLQVMREQEEDAAAAQHVAAALEKKRVHGVSKVGLLVSATLLRAKVWQMRKCF